MPAQNPKHSLAEQGVRWRFNMLDVNNNKVTCLMFNDKSCHAYILVNDFHGQADFQLYSYHLFIAVNR